MNERVGIVAVKRVASGCERHTKARLKDIREVHA